MSATFEAKYPGRCAACDERITPGDTVTYDDDELVHAACEVTSLPHPRDTAATVCRDCWTVHAGDCL